MTVALYMFGVCVFEFTIGPTAEAGDDRAHVDGTFLGFTPRHDIPAEIPVPDRCLPWDPEDE